MKPRPPQPEKAPRPFTRARRWLIPAALLALMPKCILCALAWIGLGTALGVGGPELCGPSNHATPHWIFGAALLTAPIAVPFVAISRRKRQARLSSIR